MNVRVGGSMNHLQDPDQWCQLDPDTRAPRQKGSRSRAALGWRRGARASTGAEKAGSKRTAMQNAAAETAPHSAGSLPKELYADGHVVGAKVRVVTSHDETFEGVIFTLDPVANFLILALTEETNGETPAKSKTRILQMDALKKIEIVEKAPTDANLHLPNISEEELLKLEQKNKGIAERALASIGKGVSGEAQAIFDALSKTMPCDWEGQNIRVMEEVLIKPPYQPQNCVSNNAQVLSRVKKVLEGEKNKLRKASKVSN